MRRDDERGAIAVVTAAVIVVVLGMAAFVVDIGMQRVATRDLQALADVVSLDLARMLDGRTAQEIEGGDPSLDEATADSVARNDDDTVGDPDALDVEPTLMVPDGADPPGWREAEPDEVPEAVKVDASTSVDFGFAGAIGIGSGGAARSSTAAARSSACFHLGSYAAAIERDEDLLDPLNDVLDLGLSVGQYRALADAELSLDDLAARRGGSPGALLDGPLSLGQLVSAAQAVLQRQAGDTGPARAALDAVLDGADRDLPLVLRDTVVVADDDVDALRTDVSVLDLLGPALLTATGGGDLDVDLLDGSGLTALDAPLDPPTDFAVVSPGAQRVCSVGDPVAASSVAVSVSGELAFVRRGVQVSAVLTVDVAAGGAEFARAAPAQCRETEGGTDSYDVTYSGGVSTLSLSSVITMDGDVQDPPDGVAFIRFLGSPVDPALVVDEALGPPDVASPATVVVPDNAVNADRAPVPTGADLDDFGRLARIPLAYFLDDANVTVSVQDGLDDEEEEQALEDAEDRLRSLGRSINRTLRNDADDAADTIAATTGSYAELLGARRAGADLYGEVRPTCNGVRLVE